VLTTLGLGAVAYFIRPRFTTLLAVGGGALLLNSGLLTRLWAPRPAPAAA
jgi:hypothetical protein